MKRIVKLIISLIYFLFKSLQGFHFKIRGKVVSPRCAVLYYHSIYENEKLAFEKQMKMLKRFTKVIGSDYSGNLSNNVRYSVITFDDGFENLIDNAVPVLQKYNLPFTIFFISNYFEKYPDWEFPNAHKDQNELIMSVDQMNSLPDNLVTIGSHTANHKMLDSLSEKELVNELKNSKEKLEHLSNKQINILSFPNGIYNDSVIQKSFEVGYTRIFSIDPQPAFMNSKEKLIGRISVSGNDWQIEFWLKIMGAYFWMDYLNEKNTISRSSEYE